MDVMTTVERDHLLDDDPTQNLTVYAPFLPPLRPAAEPVAPLERLATLDDYLGRHSAATGRLTVQAIRDRRIAEATAALPEIRPARLLLRAVRLRLTGGLR